MLLACLMACQEQEHTALLAHSLTHKLACLMSRSPWPRGQPIAPTSPPPLVDRQTGAKWGPLRLRGEVGEVRAQSQPPLPPELASKSLQGSPMGMGSCRPAAGAPSRVRLFSVFDYVLLWGPSGGGGGCGGCGVWGGGGWGGFEVIGGLWSVSDAV